MAFTHTFEISSTELTIEGEIGFDGGDDIQVKVTTAPMEASIDELQKVVSFFKLLGTATAMMGEITKFEIVKKP